MTAAETANRTPASRRSDRAGWRSIAGLIGFVLAVATPLLPVTQTTATLNWPQAGPADNVTAPLITQAPVSLTATIPCDVIRDMPPAGGLVLGTAPAKGKDAALNALFVNVTPARVDITVRNVVVASVPRDRVPIAGLPEHRDHLVGGRHVRHLRRADQDRRHRRSAPASPTRTCGPRSSASSPI